MRARNLALLFAASTLLANPLAFAAETYFEELLDAQGHRLDDPEYDLIRKLYEDEARGISQYRAEKFEKAYATLSEPARHGFKRAQHTLALMHIEGQAVEKKHTHWRSTFGSRGRDR